MFPVFALVLDKDVKPADLIRLPELYTELGKGRSLSYKTFFIWVLVSVYQGMENFILSYTAVMYYFCSFGNSGFQEA